MSLFSKRIDTKKDHVAEMKAAISSAIKSALDAGVPSGLIQEELARREAIFRLADQAAIEQRMNNPHPPMKDRKLKVIDTHAEAARTEEKRMARELKAQQKAYQEALNRRTNA